MSNNIESLFTVKKVRLILFIIFFLNVVVRLPGIFQEMPPNTYCDEDLIINYAYKNYSENKIYYYGIAQINYYLAAIPSYVIEFLIKEKISKDRFIVFARLLCPVLFNSLSSLIIFIILFMLFESISLSTLFSILYTFSPMILGLSRIFYPDHYMIIFSTICLLLSILLRKGISNTLCITLGGFFVATAASIKLHGFVLILPLIISSLNFQKNRSKFKILPIKSSMIRIVWLVLCSLAFFILLNPFLYIEGFVVLKNYITWKSSIYLQNPEYMTSNTPHLFYILITFFTPFGVTASLLFFIGLIKLFQKDLKLFMMLISCPLVLIFYFGLFKTVSIRNMILTLPFVLIFIAYGYSILTIKLKNSIQRYIIILVLFIEPVPKSLFSFSRDFEIDSRIKTKEWISENIAEGSTIASNSGCFQPLPFDTVKYLPVDLGFSSEMFYPNDYNDIDYLIIDSWFGDMIEKNKHKSEQSLMIIFREKVFNNLSYINPPGLFHEDLYKKGFVRNNNFKHLQTIRGYGPSIFIYENKNRLIRNSKN